MGKKIKKILVTTGIITMFSLGLVGNTNKIPFGITAYASEMQSQSSRWEGQGDVWRVKDNLGGYLTNSWFQDELTGHWYMLGADDGSVMYAGLITDQSTGKTYLLNVEHDGTYGRMITADGMVTVNGVSVYMTFNQNHDGSYGAITSGLTEARSTGIGEKGLASIPTASAENNTNQEATDTSNNSDNNSSGYYIEPDTDWSQYDPHDIGGATGWHAGDFTAY